MLQAQTVSNDTDGEPGRVEHDEEDYCVNALLEGAVLGRLDDVCNHNGWLLSVAFRPRWLLPQYTKLLALNNQHHERATASAVN